MSPDSYITKLYEYMVYYRDNLANISLKAVCQKAENDLESARKAELLTRNEEKTFLRVNTFLENIWLKMEGITQAESDGKPAYVSTKRETAKTGCFFSEFRGKS